MPPGYYYFAYGSNLSPTQMRLRCIKNPDRSSHPIAIARLPKWRWLICEAGYANVIPPIEIRVGRQVADGDKVPVSSAEKEGEEEKDQHGEEEDCVFGILYDMDKADEDILDGYEWVDRDSEVNLICDGGEDASAGGGGVVGPGREIRPREQGVGHYNKWYVFAEVVRWLDSGDAGEEEKKKVKVLVYVDEKRVKLSPPKDEYIPRMNRAIEEAVELGFPQRWAESVMRRDIPLTLN